jgi:hypothetical protein
VIPEGGEGLSRQGNGGQDLRDFSRTLLCEKVMKAVVHVRCSVFQEAGVAVPRDRSGRILEMSDDLRRREQAPFQGGTRAATVDPGGWAAIFSQRRVSLGDPAFGLHRVLSCRHSEPDHQKKPGGLRHE